MRDIVVWIEEEGPSFARLVEVASGLDNWTPKEMEWLDSHPKWRMYELRLRQELGTDQPAVDAIDDSEADVSNLRRERKHKRC